MDAISDISGLLFAAGLIILVIGLLLDANKTWWRKD